MLLGEKIHCAPNGIIRPENQQKIRFFLSISLQGWLGSDEHLINPSIFFLKPSHFVRFKKALQKASYRLKEAKKIQEGENLPRWFCRFNKNLDMGG